MGVKIDALHDEDSEYVRAVHMAKQVEVRIRTPWYWSEFIFNNSSFGKKINKAINTMHTFALKVSNVKWLGFHSEC